MSEQAIERGRQMQELKRNEGYVTLMALIDQEIAQAQEEMRDIETEGRTLHEIGADFVRLQKLIDGLKRPQQLVQELLEEFEQADNE